MDNADVAKKVPNSVKRVWRAVWIFCFVGFYAATIFFLYLSKHRLGTPSVTTGEVVSLNNHGQIFYVYPWEAWFAQSEFAFVGIGILGVLFLRWKYGAALDEPDSQPESPLLKWTIYALIAGTVVYMFLPK